MRIVAQILYSMSVIILCPLVLEYFESFLDRELYSWIIPVDFFILYDVDEFRLKDHIPVCFMIFDPYERGVICGFFFVVYGSSGLEGRQVRVSCCEVYFIGESEWGEE